MRVKFNYEDEFLEELRLERPPEAAYREYDRLIVRITTRTRANPTLPIHYWHILAGVVLDGTLVYLDRDCGETMGYRGSKDPGPSTNQQTLDECKRVREKLVADVKALGYEVRAGVYEEGDGKP